MIQDTPMADALLAALYFQPNLVHNVNLPTGALVGMRGLVFDAIRELSKRGAPVNSFSIEDEIGAGGRCDIPSLRGYLGQLQEIPAATNLDGYVSAVVDVYERRKTEALAQRLFKDAYNTARPIADAKAEAAGELLRGFSVQNVVSAADLEEGDIEQVTDWSLNPVSSTEVRGVSTGLRGLDSIIDGLWAGLFTVAGRPSMGKTALAIRIARGVAQSKPVLYCTFESSPEVIRRRMVCAMAKIPVRQVRSGLDDALFARYVDASKRLSELPLYFYGGDTGLAHVTAAINREYHRHGALGLVVLDNLGHIHAGQENTYLERGAVCKAMKQLADRLSFTVMALNQISRGIEQRGEKRPTMSDLADSGMIEQDSDLIGLLYRDEYYNPNTETPNIIELAIVKSRIDGYLGTASFFLDRQTREVHDVKHA